MSNGYIAWDSVQGTKTSTQTFVSAFDFKPGAARVKAGWVSNRTGQAATLAHIDIRFENIDDRLTDHAFAVEQLVHQVHTMTAEEVRRENEVVVADLRRRLAETEAERDRFRTAMTSIRKAVWLGQSDMGGVMRGLERTIEFINKSMCVQSQGTIALIDELLGQPAEPYDYEPAVGPVDGSYPSDSLVDSGTMLVGEMRLAANG